MSYQKRMAREQQERAAGNEIYRVPVREVVEHTICVWAKSASEARENARDDSTWFDDLGDWSRVKPVTVVGRAKRV